jgi:hypothetical protein
MPVPDFSPGEVLTAAAMDSIGLWLVKSTTVGTTVTSVPVTDCFSANYESYKIIWTGGVGSTNVDLNVTLGSSGTNYHYSAVYSPFNNTPTALGSTTNTSFPFVGGATTTWGGANFELHAPFLAQETFFNAQHVNFAAGINTVGFLNTNTSFTGFTLNVAGGNITGGTIRVYGYRK